LQKRLGFQVSDEISNSTLIGCAFKVTKGGSATSEKGRQTPLALLLVKPPYPALLPLTQYCRIISH